LRSARYARHRSTSPAGVGWEQPESKLQKASYTGHKHKSSSIAIVVFESIALSSYGVAT